MTITEAAPGVAPVLAVRDVSVRLAGRDVLRGVTFEIGAGEFVGLIGSNGVGKTTLLRVILGLQATTGGTVSVAAGTGTGSGAARIPGAAAAGAPGTGTAPPGAPRTGTTPPRGRSARQPLVGYVPQRINLDPDMPVRAADLVALGLDGHRLGIPLPSRRRRRLVAEMLRAVDAQRFAGERVGNLSGGEQQRVMIAHALISRPRLLLLDEPLANLDIRSQQEIIALLARITRRHGVSVLISAHEMNPLLPVMDRIIYLASGRAASGTTAEVVRPDVLSKLYGHHVDVITVHGRILVIAAPGDGPEPDADTGAVTHIVAGPGRAGDAQVCAPSSGPGVTPPRGDSR
jgi:zinc/manganese transport system ATP-binding protein